MSIFLVCGFSAAWITHPSFTKMVAEVNNSRADAGKFEPLFWHFGNMRQVWLLHRAVAPASRLRKLYVRGCMLGCLGFLFGCIGMFGTNRSY